MFRKYFFLLIVLNSFFLVGYSQGPVNDEFVNAIQIDTLKGTWSNDAEYTNIGATPDGVQGSMWSISGGDSLKNVWFQFTAPQNGAAVITIDRGGVKGTISRTQAAIWESDGTTELNSIRYDGTADDITIATDSLTPGATYLMSVDVQRTTSCGTFTLGFDSILDYDFISAAENIDAIKGACSADAVYTTIGASPDGLKASCWTSNGPYATRWFEFTAATNGVAVLTVGVGGVQGD